MTDVPLNITQAAELTGLGRTQGHDWIRRLIQAHGEPLPPRPQGAAPRVVIVPPAIVAMLRAWRAEAAGLQGADLSGHMTRRIGQYINAVAQVSDDGRPDLITLTRRLSEQVEWLEATVSAQSGELVALQAEVRGLQVEKSTPRIKINRGGRR